MQPTITLAALPEPEAKPARPKVVDVAPDLHDLLRKKAANESRTIKEIVDTQLRALFQPTIVEGPSAS